MRHRAVGKRAADERAGPWIAGDRLATLFQVFCNESRNQSADGRKMRIRSLVRVRDGNRAAVAGCFYAASARGSCGDESGLYSLHGGFCFWLTDTALRFRKAGADSQTLPNVSSQAPSAFAIATIKSMSRATSNATSAIHAYVKSQYSPALPSAAYSFSSASS